jgi:thiamine-phosphate pyrophosphorylase
VLPVTPGLCRAGTTASLLRELSDIKSAGAGGVLLREPALPDREMLELARAAREIFHDGWLGVHDRAHVAMSVRADGVHLGYQSLAPEVAKDLLGLEFSVGHSQHAAELNQLTMAADYRFLSPVYPTLSKPAGGQALGLSGLRSASMPERTWALGGIGPDEVREVLACGLAGVAAISGVFSGGRAGSNLEAMLRASGA